MYQGPKWCLTCRFHVPLLLRKYNVVIMRHLFINLIYTKQNKSCIFLIYNLIPINSDLLFLSLNVILISSCVQERFKVYIFSNNF